MKNEYTKEKIIIALSHIYPELHKVIDKDLNDDETNKIKNAMATLLFYAGTQEQYYEYKNNYL